jgi:TPR repeat protein
MYKNGTGVEKNGSSLVQTICKSRQFESQVQYCLMYQSGKGVLQDYKEAHNWFTKALEGNSPCLNALSWDFLVYMNAILLDLLAFGSVLSGILVITSRNPVISVLFLISTFVNVACYLILLGINFIGLTYLIV